MNFRREGAEASRTRTGKKEAAREGIKEEEGGTPPVWAWTRSERGPAASTAELRADASYVKGGASTLACGCVCST